MRYKIFLISWSLNSLTFARIARKLKDDSCDIVYWVAKTGETLPDKKDFPGVIFQNLNEAVRARPAEGMDMSDFEPPGEDVIESLFRCESLSLSMMSRLDASDKVPFHRRKILYYNMLAYWYGVLRKTKPDAIVFGFTPHVVFDFVLYSLAKLLMIKTVILYKPMQMSDNSHRTLIIDDIKIGSRKLIEELNNINNVRIEDLAEDIREYCASRAEIGERFRFTRRTEQALKSKRVFDSLNLSNIKKKIFVHIKALNFLGKSWHYIYKFWSEKYYILGFEKEYYTKLQYLIKLLEWQKIKRGFMGEYYSLQSDVDWDKKFIFVALHYQPEATTSPEGGIFGDQFLMINMLSSSIPEDWVIYVKEHPAQWKSIRLRAFNHLARYKGYYEKISSLNNVALIPTSTSTAILIERCEAVATVSGTVGFEAILKGKPALIFGYPPYKECTEIMRISTMQSCREAIEEIKNGYRPDEQKILNYLGALDKVSIKSYYDSKAYAAVSPHLLNKSINEIASAICNELSVPRTY